MPSVKLVTAIAVAGVALAGCGEAVNNPPAGSANVSKGRGKVDDPRVNQPNHVLCLQNAHIQVTKTEIDGVPGLRLGSAPGSPTVAFEPSAGVAQGLQIQGQPAYRGAEVIGSALLFPGQASDHELTPIENCLAQGVAG
jgi:hypothetical protein